MPIAYSAPEPTSLLRSVSYSLDILDKNLNFKATIQNFWAINSSGDIIDFNRQLSEFGETRFRVNTKDPLFASEGDLMQPWAYHVRIRRSGLVVWQGVIVKNTHRTKEYIEVVARTYLYMLDKVLIKHDAADGNGGENFRTVQSGTLAAFITTILTEAKANSNGLLTNLTIGTIDNPNFPPGFTDANGTALTGAWTFSANFQLKFDYKTILYVIRQLAAYANFDFDVDETMTFSFRNYIGNKQPQLVFNYGLTGNMQDYDLPLDGINQTNDLLGLAADNSNNILSVDIPNSASVQLYGSLQGVAAFADVKNKSILTTRVQETLRFTATPDAEVHIVPKRGAYPLGQYNLGDTVTIKIKDGITNFTAAKRIVMIDVKVHNTGAENIRLITNEPRDSQ